MPLLFIKRSVVGVSLLFFEKERERRGTLKKWERLTLVVVVNPPESKLAKHISVHCFFKSTEYFCKFGLMWQTKYFLAVFTILSLWGVGVIFGRV